jgi:FdhD protein
MDKTEELKIINISRQGRQQVVCDVVKELPVSIFLNGRELVTTLCSPAALDRLAVGMLAAEGIIDSRSEIKELSVDADAGTVWVETAGGKNIDRSLAFKPLVASGGGKGGGLHPPPISKIDSKMTLETSRIRALVAAFLERSDVYRSTGGVHGAALCDSKEIILFHDDIGRHNAIDKVFGECILEEISLDNRCLITSGRVSSEILLRVARRGVPILISKAAPTNLGVALAERLSVTIVRSMRDGSINVYSHDWRITASDGE